MLRTVNDNLVRGFLHEPEHGSGDGLVLTHGAGANCQAPLLVALGNAFSQSGITVLRCDLPFRQKRPHGPPSRGSAEVDQQGLREAILFLRREIAGRVFLGGHSYGGRQASMLAAADPDVADGLLLLSYPLHPPKRPTELRTAHFAELRTPALFVHGSRDGFGTHEELREAMKLVPSRTELLEVAAAGHELLTKRNVDELPREISAAFAEFYQIKAWER
jgi:predicted alpha/beta-hydrolase family hydrolase